MLKFKKFVNPEYSFHFDPNKNDPNNPTQEELVQAFHFGENDYLPFENHRLTESVDSHPTNAKRAIINNDGKTGPAGLVVPKHILEGAKARGGGKLQGMDEINKKRAEVYGNEYTTPLSSGKMVKHHEEVLEDHFSKPKDEQIRAEKEALGKLRKAGHIGKTANTLDKGEKTDTVHHETDEAGRNFIAKSSKGIAGHTFYTSSSGADQKHHVVNTCSGQTKGCGGGIDAKGIADTSKGICFAPKAEIQYPGAAIRRHSQTQAMLDPRMSSDWIKAHAGSLRAFGNSADKKNKRALFRPNVLNEMDRGSSAAVLKHLNRQRKHEGKPSIISNSYGKTNEIHDPENDTNITFSNTGPLVKKKLGSDQHSEITENIKRDTMRRGETETATTRSGKDILNKHGNKTPPKNTYMVISAKRGSPTDKEYQKSTKSIKYWGAGVPEHKWSDEEKSKPDVAHYDGKGNKTTPDKAHYGHTTIQDQNGVKHRFHYQMQHVLHPRKVAVGKNKDGSDHMIPTDSRFKDHEYLPKDEDRFKSRNGKNAGAILATTPTESTTNEQHNSSFTHHVDDNTVAEIKKNKGVHEINKPEHQMAAKGNEFDHDRPEPQSLGMQHEITRQGNTTVITPKPR
jgi:hypothetical protein